MAAPTNDHRLPALDTLRVFAIVIVIFHHMQQASRSLLPVSEAWLKNLFQFAGVGVDLFFVLSGFLIARILLRDLAASPHLNLGNFLWRRWMRTFPAYYATLLLVLLGQYVISRSGGGLGQSAGVDGYFPHFFLFTQNYATSMTHFAWSWSLCVEEHFYIALPLLVVTARRLWPAMSGVTLIRSIAVMGFTLGLGSRLATIALAGPDFFWMRDVYFRTHLHLDGITVGVFIATLPRPQNSKLGLAGAVLSVLAMLVLSQFEKTWFFENIGFTVIAIGFGWIVHHSAGGNAWSRLTIPGMKFIADISYSLYLLHLIVIGVFDRKWGGEFSLLLSVSAFAGCFVAAIGLRYAVEIPFLKVRDRLNPFLRGAPAASKLAAATSTR